MQSRTPFCKLAHTFRVQVCREKDREFEHHILMSSYNQLPRMHCCYCIGKKKQLKFDHPTIRFYIDPSLLRRKFCMQVVPALKAYSTEEKHDCSRRHVFAGKQLSHSTLKWIKLVNQSVWAKKRVNSQRSEDCKITSGHEELTQCNPEHHFC